jgi:hypothetical protein
MPKICIPKENIDKFRQTLKNKELDIAELMKMSTEERTALFSKFAGENAKDVNLLFEKKLILKNRIQGIKNWASKLGEIGRYDPKQKEKIAQLIKEYETTQQERMFNPKENEGFLADLVEEKLGVRISKDEAKTVFDLQSKVDDLFVNFNKETEKWTSKEAEANYGASRRALVKYIDGLKSDNLSVFEMVKKYGQETKESWKNEKFKTTEKTINDFVATLANNMINAVSTWDNSFMGRQGAITLAKSPKTWWEMAKKSMSDFYKTAKGSNPEDILMAEIYSDPDFINGNYEKAKISFGIEEEIPAKLLERLPKIGSLFKASDVAFTDSAIRARRGLFKIMKNVYEKKNIPLDDTVLEDIGTVVNSITARGKTGRVLGSPIIKTLMWAPKMLKADWDVLTGHTFGLGLNTKTARIEAAKTITNLVIMTTAISAIAEGMGAEVEKDPRSTDFLKIKNGDTRINSPFLRGIPQLITLLSRLSTGEVKTASGIYKKLNTGEYGARTLFDVGIDFLVNKTTPPTSAVINWMKGSNFAGEKPTAGNVAFGFLPISVQNFIKLKDTPTDMAIFGAFIDLFGVGSNTYSSSEADWGEDTGKELQKFKEAIGEDKFKEANDLYNQRYNEWLQQMKTNETYNSLSNEDKESEISSKKSKIKDAIFKEYGFKYKKEKLPELPNL